MFLYKRRVFGKDNEYRKLIITGSELDMSWNQVSHRGICLLFQYIQHCQEQFVFNSMMPFNIVFSFNYTFLISNISYPLNFLVFQTSNLQDFSPLFEDSCLLLFQDTWHYLLFCPLVSLCTLLESSSIVIPVLSLPDFSHESQGCPFSYPLGISI